MTVNRGACDMQVRTSGRPPRGGSTNRLRDGLVGIVLGVAAILLQGDERDISPSAPTVTPIISQSVIYVPCRPG